VTHKTAGFFLQFWVDDFFYEASSASCMMMHNFLGTNDVHLQILFQNSKKQHAKN
jgi:hypothetical protein